MRARLLLVTALAACGASGDARPTCALATGGPYWLEEGQTLAAVVRCSGELATGEAELSIAALPPGASFDAASGALGWTPALDQADVWRLEVLAGATGERAELVIGVADAFDTAGNVPPLRPASYTHELGLPVLFLSWTSPDPGFCVDSVARDYAPASLMADGHAYAGVELRCRGAASLNFPKKSFTLKFDGDDRFTLADEVDVFADKKRVVLTQTFDDLSYMRTRLAFELWNRLGDGRIRLEHASAVVYLDGRYWGLYQVTDHVDDDLIEAHGLDPAGNLYKSYSHDGNLRSVFNDGTPKSDLTVGYEQKDGAIVGDHADLDALLTWTTGASDADFAAELDSRLHRRDFVDWYVFATAIMAQDSYGKNSYLYKDASDPQAVWRFVPWDMNHSWGQDWQTFRLAYDQEGKFAAWPTTTNGVWGRMATIPALAAELEAAFRQALAGPMSLASVLDEIDRLAERLRPGAERDLRAWQAQHRAWSWWSSRTDFQDFDGEVAYVEQWVRDRWAYLGTLY
jgi:spore coat protein H